jgi:prolyl 4-hydroxylase
VAPYGVPAKPKAPGEVECEDEDGNCRSWANLGECSKNPGFMHTQCRKSCKVCDPAKTNTGVIIDVPVKTA